ncbi:hypothetical protein GURASL_20590 [Geotalea uraniireducens]|uniref:Uncharacterized protein n=1 Tax=Geotalea uraniireducens TaxID=351604 RepID=A0ABN6VW04_9BACT|nr:hypothetical protein [Geotalea uraniireducens]BDV43136.1 hypothetical protein GURASL_20590 [Geotalea uraniireducens]
MKKTVLVIGAIIALEGIAFAAGKIPTATMSGKAFTLKPSSNVEVSYYTTNGTTNAAGTINTNYIANTKNISGNTVFSSSNNTSNIYYQENDDWKGKTLAESGVAMTDPTKTTDTDYANAGGWSSK